MAKGTWSGVLAVWLVLPAVVPAQEPRPPIPVWIDTDPAIGEPDRDVDDGLALIQVFRSPELAVRGVSVVFGNAPLDAAWPIGRTIVERFGPRGLVAHKGAAGAPDLGVETDASRAIGSALEREPLTILALGPLTNVATTLVKHPALADRVEAIVAVAGRRPGQRFTTGTVNPRAHRDFNFEQDPEAVRAILETRVPLVLAPFEISSRVWITEDDVRGLDAEDEAARWLAGPTRRWLNLWKELFDVDGFNPFDTLAVGYLTNPDWFTCEDLPIEIQVGPDDGTEARLQGTNVPEKPYLVLSAELGSSRRARYCSTADAAFKPDLLRRLGSRTP